MTPDYVASALNARGISNVTGEDVERAYRHTSGEGEFGFYKRRYKPKGSTRQLQYCWINSPGSTGGPSYSPNDQHSQKPTYVPSDTSSRRWTYGVNYPELTAEWNQQFMSAEAAVLSPQLPFLQRIAETVNQSCPSWRAICNVVAVAVATDVVASATGSSSVAACGLMTATSLAAAATSSYSASSCDSGGAAASSAMSPTMPSAESCVEIEHTIIFNPSAVFSPFFDSHHAGIVSINADGLVSVFIHGDCVDESVMVECEIPTTVTTEGEVIDLLVRLDKCTPCQGDHGEHPKLARRRMEQRHAEGFANFSHCLRTTRFRNQVGVLVNNSATEIRGVVEEWNDADASQCKYYVIRNADCTGLCPDGHTNCSGCDGYSATLDSMERREGNTSSVLRTSPRWMGHSDATSAVSSLQHDVSDAQFEIDKLLAQNKELRALVGNERSNKNTLDLSDDTEMHGYLCRSMDTLKDSVLEQNPEFQAVWADQKKWQALSDPKGMRWHPTTIKWCLWKLGTKGYSVLQADRRVLRLPSNRTLRAYRNVCHEGSGITSSTVPRLSETVKGADSILSDEWARKGMLIYDGIHIKQDLVWDAYTGKFAGFVDSFGGELDEKAMFKTSGKSHESFADVMGTEYTQFYFRSVGAKFATPVAGWCTKAPNSVDIDIMVDQCEQILWTVGLDVVIEVCDGASAHRKRQQARCTFPHGDDEFKVAYTNPYSRSLVFCVSDIPHIIKKARNNLSKSRADLAQKGATRSMEYKSKPIVWDTIEAFFEEDSRRGVRVLHKLKPRHIYLNSFTKMRVNLAAQASKGSIYLCTYVCNFAINHHVPQQLVTTSVTPFVCYSLNLYAFHFAAYRS